jgi:hypothetical protein
MIPVLDGDARDMSPWPRPEPRGWTVLAARANLVVIPRVFPRLARSAPAPQRPSKVNSRVEFLKAIREVIDDRIDRLTAKASHGTKISVE